MTEFTGREKALISRGYSEEDVLRFSRVPENEIRIAADRIFNELTENVCPSEHPVCYYVGAQPGCGKSTMIRQIKSGRLGEYYVDLAMDDYRSFHPLYDELEELIERHWEDREETTDDMPGSDIADFTQNFSGQAVDILEEMVTTGEERYSILYEWAMRSSEEPLASMQRLKERGYEIMVNFIAVNKAVSLDACRTRAVIMNSKGRVFRAIPDFFHTLSVERIPDSCNEIYAKGKDIITDFFITDRRGEILWRSGDAGLPGELLRDILDNGPTDIINIDHYSEAAYEHESRGFDTKETE